MNYRSEQIIEVFYYFSIDKVSFANNRLIINFNQGTRGYKDYYLDTDNENMAKQLSTLLSEEVIKNKDCYIDL